MDQYLKFLWASLAPDGPNALPASQFLRPVADLAIVFLANGEDCSIDPDFASPGFACSEGKDCPGWDKGLSTCKTDSYSSNLYGKEIRLCHGVAWFKNHDYSRCGLLVLPRSRKCVKTRTGS
ncbi:MAG: hypothetical protein FJ109_19665 [Deltaproteobacteria bacterium]|nr:hypothetical protein [Deltaproteobacteria bacterium]